MWATFKHGLTYVIAYSILLVLLCRIPPATLKAEPWRPYVGLVIMLIPSMAVIRWLARGNRDMAEAIVAVATNAIGMILFFAVVYYLRWLADPCTPLAGDREGALYFSIVTWTTLGYGDVQPPADLRLFAAFEAMLGYLYLGLLVTLLAKALRLNR